MQETEPSLQARNDQLNRSILAYPSMSDGERSQLARSIIDDFPWRLNELLHRTLPLLGGDLPSSLHDHLQHHMNLDYLKKLTRAVYEPYDPYEALQKARKLSPDEESLTQEEKAQLVRRRIDTIKQMVIAQEDGLSQIILDIYQNIRSNPDKSRDELFATTQKMAPVLRLPLSYVSGISSALTIFEKQHNAVIRFMHEHPDPASLYQICFGKFPTGNVSAKPGMITIHLSCQSDEDYLYAYTHELSVIHHESIDKRRLRKIALSGGSALGVVNDYDLRDVITIQRYHTSPSDAFIHEEQHQLTKLFNLINLRLLRSVEFIKILTEPDPQKAARRLIHDYMTSERRTTADVSARSEIISFYKEGKSTEEILDLLLLHSVYDYQPDAKEVNLSIYTLRARLKEEINDLKKSLTSQDIKRLRSIFRNITNSQIRQIIASCYGPQYDNELPHWIHALVVFEQKGYGRLETLSYLFQTPVELWPSMARRRVDKK